MMLTKRALPLSHLWSRGPLKVLTELYQYMIDNFGPYHSEPTVLQIKKLLKQFLSVRYSEGALPFNLLLIHYIRFKTRLRLDFD